MLPTLIVLCVIVFFLIIIIAGMAGSVMQLRLEIGNQSTVLIQTERRNLHNSFMMLSFVLEYAKEHEQYEYCDEINKIMSEIKNQILEHDRIYANQKDDQ